MKYYIQPGDVTAHKCIHCKDGLVILVHSDNVPTWEKGLVAHTKPEKFAGIHGTIPCAEFNRLTTRQVRQIYKNRPVVTLPTEWEQIPEKQG